MFFFNFISYNYIYSAQLRASMLSVINRFRRSQSVDISCNLTPMSNRTCRLNIFSTFETGISRKYWRMKKDFNAAKKISSGRSVAK